MWSLAWGYMKKIKLTHGKYAIVDNDDFEVLNNFKWHYADSNENGKGYAARTVNYNKKDREKIKKILMHRQIMGAAKGESLDHINRNCLDNRRSNLRFCTASQNSQNRIAPKKKSTLPPKGVDMVYANEGRNIYFRARIMTCGKRLELGLFEDSNSAKKAYIEAAKKYHGEFAKW